MQEGGRTPGRARRAAWDATRRGCATVEALAQGGAAAGEATRGACAFGEALARGGGATRGARRGDSLFPSIVSDKGKMVTS